MKYSKYKSKAGFFAGKGFYLVLAVCIIAVGAAAFTAVSTITSMEESLLSSSERPSSLYTPPQSQTASVTEQVQKPVSDVPDTREESPSSAKQSSEQTSSEEETVYFKIPLEGNIGKTFSSTALQYSETYGDMRLHLGVDIQADKGAQVVSAAKGKITKIADDSLWGRMVVIDHGSGIVVYYCGLENLTVSEGETVKAGIKLGEVGTVPCECEDKTHIHIAVTRDGEYISPLDLIAQ